MMSDEMELLAPAGDEEALEAAIASGANAVYLGLQTLNARRGAKNFSVEDLSRIVQSAHARNVRIFLTLNIDVAQRELGQAVRMLKAAADSAVDAVLVRDPAVIHLRKHFPNLEFHFSTQTCIANSADAAAARQLGANRVVLARELSLPEIAACARTGQIETEVFVQGALCFCVSGRCLLSSWTGGRSGNRGTCTSPCRVPYTANDEPLGTPLSMKDLTAVHRLADLQAAGVRSLKIEGRLKSARWVGQAVSLFSQALHGGDPKALLAQAEQLGAYTGRQLTDGYLDAKRDDLVAESKGRLAAPMASETDPITNQKSKTENPNSYSLAIDVTDAGILCTCRIDDRTTSWTLPKTVVHRVNKAITIQRTLDWLKQVPVHEHTLSDASTNSPDFLMVPRAANALPDQISQAIRHLEKTEDDTIRLDLSDELRALLHKPTRHEANALRLGNAPNRVRLETRHLADFVRRIKSSGKADALPSAIILEQVSSDGVEKALSLAAGVPLVVALPSVFFEPDISAVQQLISRCAAANVAVEVNNWGGWKLAQDAGARIEAGPGLGILNTLAATMLQDHGCQSVSASLEADRKQLEDLSASCPAPLSITIFGRPPLMVTRVKMDRDAIQGRTLRDRRGVELRPRIEHGLWVLRPATPFDLRPLRNNAIHAANLVMDLVASPSPADEYLHPPRPGGRTLRFNYGRTLA